MRIMLDKNWTVAGSWPFTVMQSGDIEKTVDFQNCTPVIPAKVPGSVYDDLMNAGLIQNPYYEQNSLLCEWVANRFWSYKTTFDKPDTSGRRVRLVMNGIDYHAHVYVNNIKIAEHEGMYVPIIADITEYLKDGINSLVVIIENAPNELGQIGYTSRTFTQKARFGYKWDFGTRLVNLGIYDTVYLDIADDPLENVHIKYIGEGNIIVTAKNKKLFGELSFDGVIVASGESVECENGSELTLHVENPKLWYPNGSGEQPLYDLTVSTRDDSKTYRIGLRTIEYMQPDCADKSCLPYIPVINGKRIFIKGVNMTPLDHMYGIVDRTRYRNLLNIAKQSNVNLIRVWGGGIIEKEEFYDICDELGIMVWQEFIQSSSGIDNIPSKRPEFLDLCEKTARAVIPVKRNHVSLTYWSGGNELMDENGIPSTYEDVNIAMLKRTVDELNPEILMLPTSASGPTEWFDAEHPERNQDIHGPWKYCGVTEQYTYYNNVTMLLHSEFGVDGVSNLSSLRTILSKDNLVPSDNSNRVWRHHGEWWDTYGERERKLFGELDDIGELIKLSQFMQGEGIRYAIEAHRRRSVSAFPVSLSDGETVTFPKQECVGSIVWQINEPWPCTACTCMVDYYGKPKLAMSMFRDVEEALHVSVRYDKLVWNRGETFEGYVFVNDDNSEGYGNIEIKAYKYGYSMNSADNREYEIPVNYLGNKISFAVPGSGEAFYLETVLKKKDGECYRNVYMYLFTDENGKVYKKPVIKYYDEYRVLH